MHTEYQLIEKVYFHRGFYLLVCEYSKNSCLSSFDTQGKVTIILTQAACHTPRKGQSQPGRFRQGKYITFLLGVASAFEKLLSIRFYKRRKVTAVRKNESEYKITNDGKKMVC